jgi:quinol monooxygenase YgiN
MHGFIGSFIAKPGTRDALVALLQGSARSMPGCLSYVISTDPENPDAVWVTEAWESAEAHKASLSLLSAAWLH